MTEIINNMARKQLLSDPAYDDGFGVMGVNDAKGRENLGYFTYGGAVDAKNKSVWQIGQWGGSGDLSAPAEKEISKGVWRYSAGGKCVTVNRNSGAVTLAADARKEYAHLRKNGEGWVHVMIEQNFSVPAPFSSLKHLFVTLDYSIDKCDNYCGDGYDKELHAAQITLYFTLCNQPEKTEKDPVTGEWSHGRYNEYLWFGVPIFDNRKPYQAAASVYDAGTSSFISSIDTRKYQTEQPVAGKRYRIEYDVLSDVCSAVKMAKDKGVLKNVDEKNMVFTYMNFGWEIPGTFDVSLTINKIRIEAE